jgi:hypothetical protein
MAALEGAGFAISALREPIPAVTAAFTHWEQWTRIPLFLWLKAGPLPLLILTMVSITVLRRLNKRGIPHR